MDGAIWSLLGESDPTYSLAEVASAAWLLGTIAAAVTLWREHGWRVAVPLALGGAVFFESHFPPFGAVAGALLAIAAWQFLYRTRRAPRMSESPMPAHDQGPSSNIVP